MKLCSEKWAVTTDVFLLEILWLFEALFKPCAPVLLCSCYYCALNTLSFCVRGNFYFVSYFFWHFQPLGQMLCAIQAKALASFFSFLSQWFLFSSGWCGWQVGTGSQESHWEAVALSGTEWPLFHPPGCLCGERREDKDELCRYIKGQLQNVLFLSQDERQPGLFGPSGSLFTRINKLV